MRRYLLPIFCMLAVCAYAQDMPKGPDLQTIDASFFDPTRKPDKVREDYHFHVDYRIELGYHQAAQRMMNDTNTVMYLHGIRLGGNATFQLPLHFSLQAGVLYTLSYGVNEQHWRSVAMSNPRPQVELLQHRILQHNLTIPIRAYYTIPLYKQLSMFFYTGPQLQFTLGETDYVKQNLSAPALAWMQQRGIKTEKYDRVWSGQLYHTNIQYGLGGGFEWDVYRLQAGYDFGLNNRFRQSVSASQRMQEWSWYVSFSYKL